MNARFACTLAALGAILAAGCQSAPQTIRGQSPSGAQHAVHYDDGSTHGDIQQAGWLLKHGDTHRRHPPANAANVTHPYSGPAIHHPHHFIAATHEHLHHHQSSAVWLQGQGGGCPTCGGHGCPACAGPYAGAHGAPGAAGAYGQGFYGTWKNHGVYDPGDGWYPTHHHWFRYNHPQGLVYPPPNQPPAVVQYPYYTTKGPDDFFLKVSTP
ncbi:MAG: hypothetical protein KY476_05420 [Planctomycetes bacterium]|nr:hypothetical protein [Planctomycetota bacterium]